MSFNINLPPNAPGTVAPPNPPRRPLRDMASAESRLAAVAELPPHHAAMLAPYVDEGFEDLYLLALFEGSDRVLEILLSNGLADPNMSGDFPPLTIAAFSPKNLQCIDLLVDHGAKLDEICQGRTALGHACYEAKTQAVKRLIERRADVDLFDFKLERSRPPLLDSSRFCSVSSAEEQIARTEPLLDEGANIDATGRDQITALSLACNRESWPVVAYLLARGASLDITDGCGNSPRTMLLEGKNLAKLVEAAVWKDDKEAMSILVTIAARLVPDDKAARALVKMAISLAGDSPDLAERIHAALGDYLDAVAEDHPVPDEVARYAAWHNAKENFLALDPTKNWAKSSGHKAYNSASHGLDAIQLAATMMHDPHGPDPHALKILSIVETKAREQQTSLAHREALLAAATRLLEDLRNSPFKAVRARAPFLQAALWAVTHPL